MTDNILNNTTNDGVALTSAEHPLEAKALEAASRALCRELSVDPDGTPMYGGPGPYWMVWQKYAEATVRAFFAASTPLEDIDPAMLEMTSVTVERKPPTERFCVNCKHFGQSSSFDIAFCLRRKDQSTFDVVLGRWLEQLRPLKAYDERESTDASCCGPQGRFYEPKEA